MPPGRLLPRCGTTSALLLMLTVVLFLPRDAAACNLGDQTITNLKDHTAADCRYGAVTITGARFSGEANVVFRNSQMTSITVQPDVRFRQLVFENCTVTGKLIITGRGVDNSSLSLRATTAATVHIYGLDMGERSTVNFDLLQLTEAWHYSSSGSVEQSLSRTRTGATVADVSLLVDHTMFNMSTIVSRNATFAGKWHFALNCKHHGSRWELDGLNATRFDMTSVLPTGGGLEPRTAAFVIRRSSLQVFRLKVENMTFANPDGLHSSNVQIQEWRGRDFVLDFADCSLRSHEFGSRVYSIVLSSLSAVHPPGGCGLRFYSPSVTGRWRASGFNVSELKLLGRYDHGSQLELRDVYVAGTILGEFSLYGASWLWHNVSAGFVRLSNLRIAQGSSFAMENVTSRTNLYLQTPSSYIIDNRRRGNWPLVSDQVSVVFIGSRIEDSSFCFRGMNVSGDIFVGLGTLNNISVSVTDAVQVRRVLVGWKGKRSADSTANTRPVLVKIGRGVPSVRVDLTDYVLDASDVRGVTSISLGRWRDQPFEMSQCHVPTLRVASDDASVMSLSGINSHQTVRSCSLVLSPVGTSAISVDVSGVNLTSLDVRGTWSAGSSLRLRDVNISSEAQMLSDVSLVGASWVWERVRFPYLQVEGFNLAGSTFRIVDSTASDFRRVYESGKRDVITKSELNNFNEASAGASLIFMDTHLLHSTLCFTGLQTADKDIIFLNKGSMEGGVVRVVGSQVNTLIVSPLVSLPAIVVTKNTIFHLGEGVSGINLYARNATIATEGLSLTSYTVSSWWAVTDFNFGGCEFSHYPFHNTHRVIALGLTTVSVNSCALLFNGIVFGNWRATNVNLTSVTLAGRWHGASSLSLRDVNISGSLVVEQMNSYGARWSIERSTIGFIRIVDSSFVGSGASLAMSDVRLWDWRSFYVLGSTPIVGKTTNYHGLTAASKRVGMLFQTVEFRDASLCLTSVDTMGSDVAITHAGTVSNTSVWIDKSSIRAALFSPRGTSVDNTPLVDTIVHLSDSAFEDVYARGAASSIVTVGPRVSTSSTFHTDVLQCWIATGASITGQDTNPTAATGGTAPQSPRSCPSAPDIPAPSFSSADPSRTVAMSHSDLACSAGAARQLAYSKTVVPDTLRVSSIGAGGCRFFTAPRPPQVFTSATATATIRQLPPLPTQTRTHTLEAPMGTKSATLQMQDRVTTATQYIKVPVVATRSLSRSVTHVVVPLPPPRSTSNTVVVRPQTHTRSQSLAVLNASLLEPPATPPAPVAPAAAGLSAAQETAAQAGVTAVVASSTAAGSGAAFDFQAMVVSYKGVGRCIGSQSLQDAGDSGTNALFPLQLGDGASAPLAGVATLVGAAFVLHVIVLQVMSCMASSSSSSGGATSASSRARFPRLTLKVVAIAYQGACAATIRSFAGGDAVSTGAALGGGIVLIFYAIGSTIWVMRNRDTLPYAPLDQVFADQSLLMRRLVLPRGFWVGGQQKLQFGPLFAWMQPGGSQFVPVPFIRSMLLAIAAEGDVGCNAKIGLTLGANLVTLALRILLQPQRIGLANSAAVLGDVLVLASLALGSLESMRSYSLIVAVAAAAVSVIGTVGSAVLWRLRRRRWKEAAGYGQKQQPVGSADQNAALLTPPQLAQDSRPVPSPDANNAAAVGVPLLATPAAAARPGKGRGGSSGADRSDDEPLAAHASRRNPLGNRDERRDGGGGKRGGKKRKDSSAPPKHRRREFKR